MGYNSVETLGDDPRTDQQIMSAEMIKSVPCYEEGDDSALHGPALEDFDTDCELFVRVLEL